MWWCEYCGFQLHEDKRGWYVSNTLADGMGGEPAEVSRSHTCSWGGVHVPIRMDD